jgi:hypothetical protein
MTAIQQPFLNADILQRSIIFEVQAIGTDHSSDWAAAALKSCGGRVGWLAHHLAVLHLFFKRADSGGWNPHHKSGHRLSHFEQLFRVIGDIIGVPDAEIVGSQLVQTAEAQISEYDWTMEALKQFNSEHIITFQGDPKRVFTFQTVAEWALASDEYKDNQTITNARRLSRYYKSHKYMVDKAAGFMEMPTKYGNRDAYRLVPIKN